MNLLYATIYAVICLVCLLTTTNVMAHCGFYTSQSKTAKLTNDATHVVLLRHGTKTVVTIRNTYKGPLKDFAMVIPVPAKLKQHHIQTLDDRAFKKLRKLTAPQLVQFTEKPCGYHGGWSAPLGYGRVDMGSKSVDIPVKIESQFKQGEYDITILSAKDSSGLEQWLKANKYNVPRGAAKALKPYIKQGMFFLVARVDINKVKAINGTKHHTLSPLRFHYDARTFSLPVRLGLLNANGMQDLIVHILAKSRYEVANTKNVTIPTNLVVDRSVLNGFGAFYNQLFDLTLKRHPGAVVTEYVQRAYECEVCRHVSLFRGALTPGDLYSFGLDVINGVNLTSNFVLQLSAVKGVVPKQNKQDFQAFLRRRLHTCAQFIQQHQDAKVFFAHMMVHFNAGKNKVTVQTHRGDGWGTPCIKRQLRGVNASTLKGFGINGPLRISLLIRVLSTTVSSRTFQGWVLTRLHTRHDAKTHPGDLVFKPAKPIVGGRGTPTDLKGIQVEEGATPAPQNQFKARYMIMARHKGKRCGFGGWHLIPNRLVSAQGLAFTPRKQGNLATLIKSKNKPGLPWHKPKTRNSPIQKPRR